MEIPKRLRIGGHTYTVKLADLDDGKIGDTECVTNTIRIHEKAPKDQQELALLHEIICHTIAPTLGSTEMGHALLDCISEALYQVLSDNKLLK